MEISGVGGVMTWNAYDGEWEMATWIQYLNVLSTTHCDLKTSANGPHVSTWQQRT
jgi:hypothetical protein